MNKILKLSFLLMCVLPMSLMAQYSGGPDAYGYTWSSDSAVGGPAVQWIDISTSGTQVNGLTDDNYIAGIPVGFSFHYYNNDYTTLVVGSNGFIQFGAGSNIASGTTGMPTQPAAGGANNYIAGYLADLTFTDVNSAPIPNAKVLYQTMGTKCIISYYNVPFWTDETTSGHRGSNTFQFVLDNADSSITINYQSTAGPADASYTAANMNFVTCGIENITGNVGLSFRTNFLPQNYTIRINYPPVVLLQVKDVAADHLFNPGNGGVFGTRGGVGMTVNGAVRNTGTLDLITDTVRVFLQVFDSSLVTVHRDTVKIAPPFNTTTVKNITFPKLFNDNNALGRYTFRMRIPAVVAGEYNGNNTMDVEVNFVDTTNGDFTLQYDDNTFDGASDNVATLKTGVYFEPPFYPCYVQGASFGILPLTNLVVPNKVNGFIGEIYDQNFVLIHRDSIGKSTVQLDLVTGMPIYNQITVSSPYLVTSGGVYVSYELVIEDSVYNALGSDLASPISRRTYEISGGSWAPHRSLNEDDYMIRLICSVGQFANNTKSVATGYSLGQNFPNPTNGSTVVPFAIPSSSEVSLTIQDITGKVVAVQNLGTLNAGDHSAEINTANFAAGMYTYTLKSGNFTSTKKMIVSE